MCAFSPSYTSCCVLSAGCPQIKIISKFPRATSGRCGNNVESCSTDAAAAYTENYTPELGSVVADQYEVIG